MDLFFVGILEMIIVTIWTKVVTKSRILASGVVTMINVLIWYYVLQTIVDNIENWELAILYAFGCALGTMGTTWYYDLDEKKKIAKKKSDQVKQWSPHEPTGLDNLK